MVYESDVFSLRAMEAPSLDLSLDFIYIFCIYMTFTLHSYNSRGLGSGRMDYIAELLSKTDFLLIQEHWLLNENLGVFHNISNVSCHGVSAMDSSQVLVGRPHGGCSILWKSSLSCKVIPIDSSSPRFCAVLVQLLNLSLLIVNFYMPVDTRHDRENDCEFCEILMEASAIASECGADHVIYGGDFNTDFLRSASLHTISLNSFCTQEVVCEPLGSIDYTYENVFTGDRSYIDHFLITDSLRTFVKAYGCTHDGHNLSDHSTIFLKVEVPVDHVTLAQVDRKPRLRWEKAVDAIPHYQARMRSLLGDLTVPSGSLLCDNLCCTEHQLEIQQYADALVSVLQIAADDSIPKSKRKSARVPGWNDEVREHRDTAIFWHALWKQCGSPQTGWVAQIRRSTRAVYHRAKRCVDNRRHTIVASKMASSLASGDSRDLWVETKKINNAGRPSPSTMDGVTGEISIADVFASNYEDLYNSVSYSQPEMGTLQEEIRMRINDTCCGGNCCKPHHVTPHTVDGAVRKLNKGKTDGVISTDHLINSCPELKVHLSFLFTCMIRHGFASSQLVTSVIVPIPKNTRKSLNNSSNYRGIALNSPVGKMFELVVLEDHRDVLSSSHLQFGYKKGLSTSSCTFVADEVIQYYLSRNTDVHVMLLDASKAFDCVNHLTLFRTLLEKGLCPLVVRVVLQMHICQLLTVRWNSAHSKTFSASNGVKQGGILSPIFFSIYTDKMLDALSRCGSGCHIGDVFCGALAYADDIVLLAPGRSSLRCLLDTACECARVLNLKFNGAKSQYIVMDAAPSSVPVTSISFCGVEVPRVEDGLHLGNIIGACSGSKAVTRAVYDLNRRTNVLLSRFQFCSPEVRYTLFQSQCMIAYGSQLWDFSSDEVKRFYTAWRVNVRKVWGLPRATHTSLLPGICNARSPEDQLLSRSLNFFKTALRTSNPVLSLCARLAHSGSASAVSNTISHISCRFNVRRACVGHSFASIPQSPEVEPLSSLVRDLIISLHCYFGEDRTELESILKSVCVD